MRMEEERAMVKMGERVKKVKKVKEVKEMKKVKVKKVPYHTKKPLHTYKRKVVRTDYCTDYFMD